MNGEVFLEIIILFAIYSFLGWVIETIYVSQAKKEFVNRGFLKGPFCPIYGIGAILVIQTLMLANNNITIISESLFLKLIAAILLATVLEYITGYLLEKLFDCKWWDYSERFLNVNGRICLLYSMFWGFLSFILITVVHPVTINFVNDINFYIKLSLMFVIIIYFAIDTINSVSEIIDLKKVVLSHYENPLYNFTEQISRYKRIFQAFPRIHFFNVGKLNQEIKGCVQNEFKKIRTKLRARK
ncbi:putative membrane protein [Natranaerovirga hydrolytica]|uniref:Putative membrane protein n=1 Tax=Natranaerovirga hydrolytica TaxID=680378 RepID=A0A4R1MND3_9FIRM|nr:putative ABC transporter permease [Natranaerovirga hydrolytica]TCK93452.1 putative membrane protein [Natranaerovirga hydrolytica]